MFKDTLGGPIGPYVFDADPRSVMKGAIDL